MIACLWITLVMQLIGVLLVIGSVGKQRAPISGGVAALTALFGAFYILTIFAAIQMIA